MNLLDKILLHERAYKSIGEEVLPYKLDLIEWNKEFLRIKNNLPSDASFLDIDRYAGIKVELVVAINPKQSNT